MGGAGPAADDSGNVFISTGNGPYDGTTAFGESVMKFDRQLHLLDHFTPFDSNYMNCADADLAAGGVLLIPGSSEALAGGKTGKIYLLNAASLGGQQANDAGATRRPSRSNLTLHLRTPDPARIAGERGQRISILTKFSGRLLPLMARCIWE